MMKSVSIFVFILSVVRLQTAGIVSLLLHVMYYTDWKTKQLVI